MRVIAFFQPGWADWEAGPVLAMLREQCGAEVSIVTPMGGPVTSIGGVRAAADGAFGDVKAGDADVFLAIGSDGWPGFHDAAFFALMRAILDGGAVLGVICAATVAAARAGLFGGRPHTSNGRAWLLREAPDYVGREHYVDTPRAVTSGRLVSASGYAPGTFCGAVLRLAAPERASDFDRNDAMMAKEWIS